MWVTYISISIYVAAEDEIFVSVPFKIKTENWNIQEDGLVPILERIS